MDGRWELEQVHAIAPSARAIEAAEPLAAPGQWLTTGCDDRLVWGRVRGGRAEPYDVAVHHVDVVTTCTCASRQRPCKHALALLLAWVRGDVPTAPPPASVARWGAASRPPPESDDRPAAPDPRPSPPAPPAPIDRHTRDDRIARLREGLVALEQWLDDRLRLGLADPSVARYATWDDLAARLVDARAGALANRVRRVAGLVGVGDDWHAAVLEELGLLHLLANAALRLPDLPDHLADAVGLATGWQVRQADVLAGVPETDRWHVLGRSDTREDRIEVRRCWLRGERTGRWAMVLSFAAYQQALDRSLPVGTSFEGDLHRYPGDGLRVLVGRRVGESAASRPEARTLAAALDEIGRAVAQEPWLDRLPATVRASLAADGRALTDGSGSVRLVADDRALRVLTVAATEGPLTLTVEWVPAGLRPLTLHLADRVVDIGPTADPSFVAAA
ncbi:MAG: SWIM zinc finger domain-containing protein [Ilumatobacteraceae bacterium]|nr:SWIM zinc finger domain-containing protein [Ilumatobacteraceae bacterium]